MQGQNHLVWSAPWSVHPENVMNFCSRRCLKARVAEINWSADASRQVAARSCSAVLSRREHCARDALLVVLNPLASSAPSCCWCDKDTPKDATSITGSDGTLRTSSSRMSSTRVAPLPTATMPRTALNIGDTSNKGAAFYLPEQANALIASAASLPC